MTTISILNGDWEILLDDEKNMDGGTLASAGMRTIRKAVAEPTIVTTRTLYSAVADAMDDFVAMGFRNGMLPTTPNAFTLENKYFMPRSSAEYLKEGAVTAEWGLTSSPDTNGNGVLKVQYSVGAGANFVATDIGRRVIKVGGTDAGDTGTLLDFDIDPDGTLCAWIRPDDSDPTTGDLFDDGTTGTINVTGDGGTGNVDVSAAGAAGTTQWSAIQAIGSVPTATEVYVYQDRIKLPDSAGGFQWWETDPDLSLGIISILVQVKDSGTTIADGDVEIFARRYTALYDNFRLNVVGGGFSALPLASSPDINNTTGYRVMTLSGATGTFDVGNGIYQGGTGWSDADVKGVITAVDDSTPAAPIIEYYLVGDLDDFTNVASTEYDFDTAADGDGAATGVGTLPASNSGGPTDAGVGEGGSVTLSLGGFLVDHTGDGVTEPYSIEVDCQGNVPISKVYERIKYACRRGAPNTDLFGAGVNVPGESYRGLDGVIQYDTPVNTLVEGDDFIVNGGTWSARLLHQNTTNSPTYVTVTDQQTSLDSVADNDELYDETLGTNSVEAVVPGTLTNNFTSPKSSPFGTFTGTQIFGARGVVYVNPNTGDEQAYILTDDLGVLRNPPNTVSFTVTNTAALDRILVARDTGTAGIIDKDQFGGIETSTQPADTFNGEGDSLIRVAGNIDVEVPQVGYVRIVENTLRQEHKYEYSSRTAGGAVGTDEFTLTAITNSSVTSTDTTGPEYTFTDTLANFTGEGVNPGMLIRNTVTGEFFEVVSVDSATQLTVVEIHSNGGSGWTATDGYTINKLIQDYATSDDLYDLILDLEADGTSVSNTFTKTLASNFGVVVNVRQGKVILPFTLNQTQGDGSTTVTVVRQPDTIAV